VATNPGNATLWMGLRAPRIAIVFDGGSRWHFWARQALHASTKLWGGRGFLLVPHANGLVRPELLAAARVYDPDYVVSLERTLDAVEQIDPGGLPLRYGGELLVGEERDRFIEQNGHFPLSEKADEQARRLVAEYCSPHRRKGAGDRSDWDESITTLPVNADIPKLTKVADIPYIGADPRLSAPAEWSGAPWGCGRRPVWSHRRCGCRKPHPSRSGCVFVLVKDAAEAVASVDVEVADRVWIGDRLG
jgi:hypothetical protein